ncbi:MAG: Spy/CpxP family protein refolding chaperone [Thermodesulfobacteriota bacterium]|nr:Spy/CpxP family protein refolding chaperone [Thermodesulfobacteriota bacterium]
MKKTTIIPVILIGILLSSGTVFAWSGGHGKRNDNNGYEQKGQGITQEQHAERMENHLGKMAIILDLTDQQKDQVKNLLENKWRDRQSARAEMLASRENLREYRQGKEFNETEFRTKAQKHADFKTEMMVQRAKTKQQIFAILTPEQQQKAENLRELRGQGFRSQDMKKRHCDGHGKRGSKGYGQRYNNG